MATKIKVELNPFFSSRIHSACEKAERVLAEQIKADCRDFVPDDEEHTLRDTADIQTVNGHAAVVWNEVYSAYQYYGCWPDGTHVIKNHTTDGTCTHWTDAAERLHRDEWETVAENAMRKFKK